MPTCAGTATSVSRPIDLPAARSPASPLASSSEERNAGVRWPSPPGGPGRTTTQVAPAARLPETARGSPLGISGPVVPHHHPAVGRRPSPPAARGIHRDSARKPRPLVDAFSATPARPVGSTRSPPPRAPPAGDGGRTHRPRRRRRRVVALVRFLTALPGRRRPPRCPSPPPPRLLRLPPLEPARPPPTSIAGRSRAATLTGACSSPVLSAATSATASCSPHGPPRPSPATDTQPGPAMLPPPASPPSAAPLPTRVRGPRGLPINARLPPADSPHRDRDELVYGLGRDLNPRRVQRVTVSGPRSTPVPRHPGPVHSVRVPLTLSKARGTVQQRPSPGRGLVEVGEGHFRDAARQSRRGIAAGSASAQASITREAGTTTLYPRFKSLPQTTPGRLCGGCDAAMAETARRCRRSQPFRRAPPSAAGIEKLSRPSEASTRGRRSARSGGGSRPIRAGGSAAHRPARRAGPFLSTDPRQSVACHSHGWQSASASAATLLVSATAPVGDPLTRPAGRARAPQRNLPYTVNRCISCRNGPPKQRPPAIVCPPARRGQHLARWALPHPAASRTLTGQQRRPVLAPLAFGPMRRAFFTIDVMNDPGWRAVARSGRWPVGAGRGVGVEGYRRRCGRMARCVVLVAERSTVQAAPLWRCFSIGGRPVRERTVSA